MIQNGHVMPQVNLLQAVHKRWKDIVKRFIFNIGSIGEKQIVVQSEFETYRVASKDFHL